MFVKLFNRQVYNQLKLIRKGCYKGIDDTLLERLDDQEIPCDKPRLVSYHIQQLISEIGEILDADKRWKSFRNNKYDKKAKLEEIADCFIVLMNIAMFSGFSAEQVLDAIDAKLTIVEDRIENI